MWWKDDEVRLPSVCTGSWKTRGPPPNLSEAYSRIKPALLLLPLTGCDIIFIRMNNFVRLKTSAPWVYSFKRSRRPISANFQGFKVLSLLPQGAASTWNSLSSNCNKVQGSASSFHDWEQLWKFQPMHVCLYFQHPPINPSNIVHYAENMHFYTQEHFLSFRSSAGGKKNKRWLSPSSLSQPCCVHHYWVDVSL